VICGHIHEPIITEKSNKKGTVLYLNSGDWIENLTALEYHNNEWSLYRHVHEMHVDEEEEYPEIESLLGQQMIATVLFNKN
jgi:hypothetical protein